MKKEGLLPITDGRVYDTSFMGVRKASRDCFISYEGNRYSVPYKNSRKSLAIRADNEKIRIYSQSEQTATHCLFGGKGKDVSDPRHFEGLKTKQKERWQRFKEAFLSLSSRAKEFWDGFLSSPQMRGKWWELRKILRLCEKYSCEDVDYALLRALKYKAFGHKYIDGILQQLRRKSNTGSETLVEILKELLSKWDVLQVEKRSLSSYDEFSDQ